MMAAHICWSKCLLVCSLDNKYGQIVAKRIVRGPPSRGTCALKKHLTPPLHALEPFPKPFVKQHDGC